MITKLINLIENNNISIDSLQVRIPLILCELIHRDLKDKKHIVNIDGEIVGKIEPNKHISSYTGVTTIYNKKKVTVKNQSTGKVFKQDYLCIGIPSKVLKLDYLEGITANNLVNVYEYLDSLEIAKFDYSVFKGGLCTDIDFKLDFDLSELDYSSFDELTKDLSLVARPTKEMGLGFNRFAKKNNKGIEFQSRKNIYKYLQNPFLKFYSKRLQMLSDKNREFTETYLTGQKIKEGRVETTAKNKKSLKSVGIQNTYLDTLVNLTEEQKQRILKKAINNNLTGQLNSNCKDLSKLNYFEKMYVLAVKNPCLSFDELEVLYQSEFSNKKDRFKARKKVEKLRPYI